jgi:hypothetical protein
VAGIVFSSLTFGTAEALEVVRDGLAVTFDLEFRTGDSGYRGGVYYESPVDISAPPYVEHWYVQSNRDMGDIAEDGWPDIPTLLYLEATTAPGERVQQIGGLAGLRLLRRDDWPGPAPR